MKIKYFSIYTLAVMLFLALNSCQKDDVEITIDPADANALTSVLIMPEGTQTANGTPPPNTGSIEAPQVFGFTNTLTSSNGSTVPLNFGYSNVNGNLGGCYVQVEGSDTYFSIPYNSNSSNAGNLSVPIGIPVNVLEGFFNVYFCVYDDNGNVSNPVSTQVNVLRLGTGALQISLSWDTPTDQDLHVIDPEGYEIYYSSAYSPSGGVLDRDDTNGYGPENIYWLSDAPDGDYEVFVNDYENSFTENTVYVTVSAPKKTKSFTATTISGNRVPIVNIRKDGDKYDF